MAWVLPKKKDIEFSEFLRRKGLRYTTVEIYERVLLSLLPQELEDVKEANKKLQDLALRRNGALLIYFYAIKNWFEYYKGKSIAKQLKKPNINFKKREPIYKPIEEVYNLINQMPDEKYRTAAKVQLFGGLRVSEVLSIKKKNITIHEDTITIVIEKAKRDPFVVFINNQTPIYHDVRTYVENYTHYFPYLFSHPINPRGYRMTTLIETNRKYYSKMLKEYVGIRTHDLKRILAETLKQKKVPIYTIKTLLHHKRIDTTMRYFDEINQREAATELTKIL